MQKFLSSNEAKYRLLRTIVQAVIGFCLANADVLVAQFVIDPVWKTIIVGLTMAVLSPIMAEMGNAKDGDPNVG